MNTTAARVLHFDEVDAQQAPDAESFWHGMWVGIGYIGAMAGLLT